MGLINAVLVEWGEDDVGGFVWVEDAGSIATWGRREAFLSLNGVRDVGTAERMATEWMSTRLTPSESLVVGVAPIAGAEPAVGDIIDVDAETGVRTMGVSWQLDESGDLVPVPEVNSLLDENRRRSALAFNRMVTVNGGGSAGSAPVKVTKSRIATGKLEEVHFTDWSSSGEFTLDDLTTWQDQPVRVPCRISKIEVNGKPGPTGDNSEFELLKNGASFTDPITISLPYNDNRMVEYVFSSETLFPGDVLTVECTQLGVHEDLSVTVHAVRAT